MRDYTDWLEQQLIGAADASLRPSRDKTRRRWGAAVVLGASSLAIVVAAGAVLLLGRPHRLPQHELTKPRDSSQRALRQAFSVLRRPRTAGDHLPSTLVAQLRGEQMNVNDSRLVFARGTMRMWLVPGAEQSCLMVSGWWLGSGGFGCSVTLDVSTRGIVSGYVMRASNRPGQVWIGLLPDGTSHVRVTEAEGRSIRIKPDASGAFVQPVRRPLRLSYDPPHHAPVTISLPRARQHH